MAYQINAQDQSGSIPTCHVGRWLMGWAEIPRSCGAPLPSLILPTVLGVFLCPPRALSFSHPDLYEYMDDSYPVSLLYSSRLITSHLLLFLYTHS